MRRLKRTLTVVAMFVMAINANAYRWQSPYAYCNNNQYTDESGSPWKLAFIRDGVVHLVSQDWGTNYIIDSDLKYLGNGIAEVNIKDINDGTVYQCCLEYSYDTKENHTNYKSTSNIITN